MDDETEPNVSESIKIKNIECFNYNKETKTEDKIILSEMELNIEFPARELIQAATNVFEDRFGGDEIDRTMRGVIDGVINKYSR